MMNVILSVAKNPAEYIARSLTSAPSADASGVDLKVRFAQDDIIAAGFRFRLRFRSVKLGLRHRLRRYAL